MAKRKTARKTSAKRSSAKAGGAKPKARGAKRAKSRGTKRTKPVAAAGLNLKKVRADLLLAIEAMKKSPALALGERAVGIDSDQAQLEEMVARINDFCERDRRCGTGMIIPI